jgi:hypothetical protein
MAEQVVTIASRTTSFTAVCATCAREAGAQAWFGATFAGRLDLDLGAGIFLCRRGHRLRVQRAQAPPSRKTEAA